MIKGVIMWYCVKKFVPLLAFSNASVHLQINYLLRTVVNNLRIFNITS